MSHYRVIYRICVNVLLCYRKCVHQSQSLEKRPQLVNSNEETLSLLPVAYFQFLSARVLTVMIQIKNRNCFL